MGYGLPAAIGANVAEKKRQVIVILGDGSFQMSMPELGTMCQWGIDVKMVLLNNHRLGMVRELQKNSFKSNYSGVFLDGSPNFCKLVEAYQIPSLSIQKDSEVKEAILKLLSTDGSFLLEANIDPEKNSYQS